MCIKLLIHLYWIQRSGYSILSEIAEGQVCDLVFYPEPALISAVVSLALLLPLPPLYQAGRMVPRQADVTAAGCGTDSSPDASEEEGLGAEWQLHPTRQRHEERAIGADSVWTLSVVFFFGGRDGYGWVKHVQRCHTKPHMQGCKYAVTDEKSVKNISQCLSQSSLKKNQWDTAADCMNAMNTCLAFCLCALFEVSAKFSVRSFFFL